MGANHNLGFLWKMRKNKRQGDAISGSVEVKDSCVGKVSAEPDSRGKAADGLGYVGGPVLAK